MASILCVGHVNWDMVLHTTGVSQPDFSTPIIGEHSSCGGSAVNTALALASFGNDAKVHGSVGTDEKAGLVRDRLVENNVEPLLVQSDEHDTTTIFAMIEKLDDGGSVDPRYWHKSVELGPFGVDYVDESVWDDIDHVHVTNASVDVSTNMVRKARENGITTSFNPTQMYDKASCESIVSIVDMVIVNDVREYDLLCERNDVDAELERGLTLIVTHGADGATVHTNTLSEPVTIDGVVPRDGTVVDTIGAGDAFIGGVLDEWVETCDAINAVAQGNASGAWTVGEFGAPDTIDPDWVAKQTHLKE